MPWRRATVFIARTTLSKEQELTGIHTIHHNCSNTQATTHIRMLSRLSQFSRHLLRPIMTTPQAIRSDRPICTSACLIIGDEVLNGKVSIRPNTPIQEITYRRIGSGHE